MSDIREGLKAELLKMTFTGDNMRLDYDELVDRQITYLRSEGIDIPTVDEPHPADEMTTAKDVAW